MSIPEGPWIITSEAPAEIVVAQLEAIITGARAQATDKSYPWRHRRLQHRIARNAEATLRTFKQQRGLT